MRIKARMDSIQRIIKPLIDRRLSPEAQSQMLAARAEVEINAAKAQNRQALGFDPAMTVIVDGKTGAAIATVKPEGRIVAEFDIVSDVLACIRDELVRTSPVLTGAYQRSHRLFVDGVEAIFAYPPVGGREYIFLNEQPYARKIEPGRSRPGQSSQAAEGVYMALAEVAAQRYGNVARITYSYRAILGSNSKDARQPAIIVRLY